MRGRRNDPRMGGRPEQFFQYGTWEFNVSRAIRLARKYRPTLEQPRHDWVGPFIEVDEAAIERGDLSQPVIFATVIEDGTPHRLLIDGNHRVLKALRVQQSVPVVVLGLDDTLKVLRAPGAVVQQMRAAGQRLGLRASR